MHAPNHRFISSDQCVSMFPVIVWHPQISRGRSLWVCFLLVSSVAFHLWNLPPFRVTVAMQFPLLVMNAYFLCLFHLSFFISLSFSLVKSRFMRSCVINMDVVLILKSFVDDASWWRSNTLHCWGLKNRKHKLVRAADSCGGFRVSFFMLSDESGELRVWLWLLGSNLWPLT